MVSYPISWPAIPYPFAVGTNGRPVAYRADVACDRLCIVCIGAAARVNLGCRDWPRIALEKSIPLRRSQARTHAPVRWRRARGMVGEFPPTSARRLSKETGVERLSVIQQWNAPNCRIGAAGIWPLLILRLTYGGPLQIGKT